MKNLKSFNEFVNESYELNESLITKIKQLFKKKAEEVKKLAGVSKIVRPNDEIFKYAQDYVKAEYGPGHSLSGIGVDQIQKIIYGSTMDDKTGAEEEWEIEIPMDLR